MTEGIRLGFMVAMFFGSLIFQGACSPVSPETFTFNGSIDDEAVELIRKNTSRGDVLEISSLGGRISSAIELANYIADKDLRVVLSGPCISACAEFILPASTDVTFSEMTLIGFHGNQYIYQELYRRFDEKDRHYCYGELSNDANKLYQELGVNLEFWETTYDKISPYSVHVLDNDTRCGLLRYKLTHQYWYPSSEQIELFVQQEIPQYICNNNIRCIITYIFTAFEKRGDSYLIHDKAFVH